ncbi:MAG: glycosyltransferase [Coriobacteriia bacterium]|nr:glycosyltransferase [Coriobacteriia bacterium]
MRIGMFCDMYMPHVSGVTNHIALYKRRFEELGHEVYLFTFGDLDYSETEHNVVRSPGMPWGDTGWRFALDHSAEVKRLAVRVDVAHVHHPFQSGRIARRICGKRGIPVVYTNHTRYDLYSDAYAWYVPKSARHAYLRAALKDAYAKAAMIVAPSAGIVEWLRTFGITDRATLLPNGIDTRPFAEPASPVSRQELGFAEEDVVFCYVGRLGPEKNTPLLAESFAQALFAAPNARLLVVGEGPARKEAERVLASAGVGDRARFVGAQPYARVPDYEAAADVFVTASVSEVHPLVVMEGMAAGLPVVGVHSPGISDTVTNGEDGLLAGAPVPEAIAERIARIATDDRLRLRLAEGARVTAQRYDLPHTADKLLEHYEQLLSMDARRSVRT